MEYWEIQPWLFTVEPFEGESISHFLGRFRRENDLSVSSLGTETGLGGAIARWEKFRFNPPPSQKELEKLAKIVQVDASKLKKMLPSQGVSMKMSPIRLCATCYGEVPCHKIEWQFEKTEFCPQHNLTLLSECSNCKTKFKIPSLWVDGWCHRCFTPFVEMGKYQKTRQTQ